jgi:tetratricopeptide (TPR) repeat protein
LIADSNSYKAINVELLNIMKSTALLSLAVIFSLATAPILFAQGNDPATNAARQGAEAAKKGDWDKAVELFRKAAGMNGKWNHDLNSALQHRGLASLKENQFQEALNDFTDALKLNPRDTGTIERRAYVEMKLNDFDQALADYSEAIKINPKEARYYNLRAYIYETKKDYKNAMADTDHALKLDPKNAEAQGRKDRLTKILTALPGLPGATPIAAPPQTPRPSPTPKK